ncbi:MAG: N-acyl-D-amino-acid deacylase family protein [Pseudoalteromonas sp.]
MAKTKIAALVAMVGTLLGCAHQTSTIDIMITGNAIYQGSDKEPMAGVIGINEGKIVFIGEQFPSNLQAKTTIDAADMVVAPGFIDPHTHACNDFNDNNVPNLNKNYTTQGVSTVFCNVDGGGDIDVANTFTQYETQGIGTNVALYIGHGSVRKSVMGRTNRSPSDAELSSMKNMVATAMQAGALGLSTGLYYVPGNYATTQEVIELAKVSAQYNGVYDSHIRDESSYNIGLQGAIKEVITIGEQAQLPVHIAHIKALGVDVWGESKEVIAMIEKARSQGIEVTADQYPWRASGTSIAGSLMPRKILAGDKSQYLARVKDESQWPALKSAIQENLRRRGGADSLLITDPTRPDIRGKTLAEIATEWDVSPIDAARKIVISGNARVASFNMSEQDIKAYMQEPWVMTSSDGSPGHPRKYATFPKKFYEFVKQKEWLTTSEFIYKSSTLTAKSFGLNHRGELKVGYIADIVIFDENKFIPKADYIHPEELSQGVQWMIINGELAISHGKVTNSLPGQVIRQHHNN